MEKRILPFGVAIGVIVLIAGIAGLGVYWQSGLAVYETPATAPIVPSQEKRNVSPVETGISDSDLEPLPAKRVAVPSDCSSAKYAFRADGSRTPIACYDFVQQTVIDNPFDTFDEYAEHEKSTMIPDLIRANYGSSLAEKELEEKVKEELALYSGEYEFWEETIDGAPALFHRRNFYGMIGNVYEMHIDSGDGKIRILSSELDNDILDTLYHSYKIPK